MHGGLHLTMPYTCLAIGMHASLVDAPSTAHSIMIHPHTSLRQKSQKKVGRGVGLAIGGSRCTRPVCSSQRQGKARTRDWFDD